MSNIKSIPKLNKMISELRKKMGDFIKPTEVGPYKEYLNFSYVGSEEDFKDLSRKLENLEKLKERVIEQKEKRKGGFKSRKRKMSKRKRSKRKTRFL